jgi:nitronate monooxygenase
VGTPFALCAESALRPDYKRSLLQQVSNGTARVFTDPLASPTGFPFKVARLEGTASEPDVYVNRPRICDLGYLREAFRTATGTIDYRCAGEPATLYAAKGGKPADGQGRKCLCNALLANIGHPQMHNGKHEEPGLVTTGDDLIGLSRFFKPGQLNYTAADVVANILG